MADGKVRGQFVWHDFVTAAPEAAMEFYPKFVPWKTQSWEKDPNYTLWLAKNGPVGGIAPLSDAASASGAKPHWLPYIATLDIEATVNEATALGALLITRPTELPNGGRYAVLADPQGAVFGIYASESTTVPGKPKPGQFSWHEHAGDDYAKAFDFYTALFGWEKIHEHDMGGALGIYLIFGLDGVQMGGMFTKPPEMPVTNWTSYVLVNNANQAAVNATNAGGKVVNGPMEVPGGDWIAQIVDPQGAYFAVHALKKAVKSKPAATAAPPEAAEPEPAPAPEAPATPPAKKKAKKVKKAPAKAKSKAKPAAKKSAAKKKAPAKKTAKKAAKKKAAGKKTAKKKVSAKAKKATKKKAAKKKAAAKKK